MVKETGLKPDTLRAWERRYGLPRPKRTSGGHRLYSQRDIDILKWLVARQKEGMSISRAVDMWGQIVAGGKDPLQMAAEAEASTASPILRSDGETVAELRKGWIEACMSFNEQKAERILAQAFSFYQPETVCFELLQKAMSDIGSRWHRGEITVQQEHFASALAIRRLEALIAATPIPTRSGRILVACPPFEEHVFSPLLITFLLRRQSWDVVYLGANVPEEDFVKTVDAAKLRLVILSAQSLVTAATLLSLAELLHEKQISLAFGGLIFNLIPELQKRVPGHFLGERLDLALQIAEQVLLSPNVPTPGEPPEYDYSDTLKHYRSKLSPIETDVWKGMQSTAVTQARLLDVNMKLFQNIEAVLKLGNMNYLSANLAWLKVALVDQSLTMEQLEQYLEVYAQAAETHLGEVGQPIVDWLNKVLASKS